MPTPAHPGPPAPFILIGAAGWRTQFYLHAARHLPHLLTCTGLLVRNPEKAAAVQAHWNIPTHQTLDPLLAQAKPLFAVVSVSRSSAPDIMSALTDAGVPILCETPPAGTLEDLLRANQLTSRGAKIQVAEQYLFQPAHAARLALIQAGLLGTPTYAHLSISHLYHNISLIRRYLSIGYEPVTIHAQRFSAPITKGPTRSGPPLTHELTQAPHTLATLSFTLPTGQTKYALYDWAQDQHRSYIRTNHVLVRGEKGELNDMTLKYLDDNNTPHTLPLLRHDLGQYENLEGQYLRSITAGHLTPYTNPFLPPTPDAYLTLSHPRLLDDEIAVATTMQKMVEYIHGAPDFYSLAEASQDTYLGLLLEEAVASGKSITSLPQSWHPHAK